MQQCNGRALEPEASRRGQTHPYQHYGTAADCGGSWMTARQLQLLYLDTRWSIMLQITKTKRVEKRCSKIMCGVQGRWERQSRNSKARYRPTCATTFIGGTGHGDSTTLTVADGERYFLLLLLFQLPTSILFFFHAILSWTSMVFFLHLKRLINTTVITIQNGWFECPLILRTARDIDSCGLRRWFHELNFLFYHSITARTFVRQLAWTQCFSHQGLWRDPCWCEMMCHVPWTGSQLCRSP